MTHGFLMLKKVALIKVGQSSKCVYLVTECHKYEEDLEEGKIPMM